MAELVPDHQHLLMASKVVKHFGGVHALKGVDLAVDRTEIVGLLGPNGSGKSTLLSIMSGFVKPDQGTVRVAGRRIDRRAPWAIEASGVRRTFQHPHMPTKMTVLEVMLAAAKLPLGARPWAGIVRPRAMGREERHCVVRAREILEQLTLLRLEHESAASLSGGQQKLLSLGAALIGDPRIILLDEPTAGVHPDLRTFIAEWLGSARRNGTTMVVVEHDMEFVRKLCDRAYVLDKGEVIACCAPHELTKDERVVRAYLGTAELPNREDERGMVP